MLVSLKKENKALDNSNCSTIREPCTAREVLEEIKVLVPGNRSNIPSEPGTSTRANYKNSFRSNPKTNEAIDTNEPTTSKNHRETKGARTTPLTIEPTQNSLESLKKENKALITSLKTILSLHSNILDETQKNDESTKMVQELSNDDLCLFNVAEFFNKTVSCLESQIKEHQRDRFD